MNKIVTNKVNVIYKNKYIELQNNDVAFPNGKKGEYIKIIEAGSNQPGVVVLCANTNGKLLLIKLFRYGIDNFSLEFPRGYKEINESFINAAERELFEEVGLGKESILSSEEVGSFFINTSNMLSEVGIVRCLIKTEGNSLNLSIDECIVDHQWISADEVKNKILYGKIKDSFTINALFFHVTTY